MPNVNPLRPRSRADKAKRYLPLLQIIAELPHRKRQLILSYLDGHSIRAIVDAIVSVLTERKNSDSSLPKLHSDLIRSAVVKHKTEFKQLTHPQSSDDDRKSALIKIGAAPLSLILSVAIPLLLGQVS